ncbi:MAG TPA: chromosomal replication initiator protein DnaA [Clostridiales bacterium]|jgi:chromosomal replication initiator protein|nr:chromosomal replication initiator protein DnaA [Clostridiales bacterium]
MNSAADVWASVLEILGRDLTPTSITTWFDDCEAVDLKDSLLVLHSVNDPTDFKHDVIVSRFSEPIRNALREIFSGDFDVLVLTQKEYQEYCASKSSERDSCSYGKNFTFERFIVGPSNKFAHAAARAVAEAPAEAYNPLFIYGDSGLGKTHLLYAICNLVQSERPAFKTLYVRGEDFTNELISAIQTNRMVEFREKYRQVDLLLVDDIQFIAGKVQTQEEFFHTFNTLYDAGKQIVLTSDRPPMDILRLEDRLRTRFESGLLADIQPPDYETRVAIVKYKAAQYGLNLTEDSYGYIAENVTSNVRQIEGLVKKLIAYRDLMQGEITKETIDRAIGEIKKTFAPTPELIMQETASYFNVTVDDLKSQSRTRDTVTARQVSMYLMRVMLDIPLKEIGSYHGGRDHSTVINSVQQVEKQMSKSSQFVDTIKDIKANITAKR